MKNTFGWLDDLNRTAAYFNELRRQQEALVGDLLKPHSIIYEIRKQAAMVDKMLADLRQFAEPPQLPLILPRFEFPDIPALTNPVEMEAPELKPKPPIGFIRYPRRSKT